METEPQACDSEKLRIGGPKSCDAAMPLVAQSEETQRGPGAERASQPRPHFVARAEQQGHDARREQEQQRAVGDDEILDVEENDDR